jgi:hypothetical protein
VIRQLAFDLPGREAMTRADFFVSPSNALALQAVDGWRDWPGRKLLLVGPEGAGKTHLAQIWATSADAVILAADRLADDGLEPLEGRAVVVEDADRIGAGEAAAVPSAQHGHRVRRVVDDRPHSAARLGAGPA